MRRFSWWAGLGLVLALGSSSAAAQDDESEAYDTNASMRHGASGEEEVDEPEAEAGAHPMNWFGLGLKLGVAGHGAGRASVMGYKTSVASRNGFQLSLPINLGGDGFGWAFDPHIQLSTVELAAGDSSTRHTVTSLGGYTGPTVTFQVTNALYLGFGLGPKAAYARSDAFDFGVELMGRVPLTVTYYARDEMGLIGELGMGYGAIGDATRSTHAGIGIDEPELNFGTVVMWDVSLGARFP